MGSTAYWGEKSASFSVSTQMLISSWNTLIDTPRITWVMPWPSHADTQNQPSQFLNGDYLFSYCAYSYVFLSCQQIKKHVMSHGIKKAWGRKVSNGKWLIGKCSPNWARILISFIFSLTHSISMWWEEWRFDLHDRWVPIPTKSWLNKFPVK